MHVQPHARTLNIHRRPPDLQMWLCQRECSPTPTTHESFCSTRPSASASPHTVYRCGGGGSSFPNPVSHRDLLTCDDASCLTSCHRAICLQLVSLLQNVGIHPLGDTAGWVGLPLMGLQRACPQIRTALEDHRVDGLVLGLDPVLKGYNRVRVARCTAFDLRRC